MSDATIGEIAGMLKAGMRPKAIVAASNLPKSTAYDLLKKVEAGTHYEVKKKTGRKRKTSPVTDRAIVSVVKRSRKVSCPSIKESLQLQNISVRTIQRRILEFKSGHTRKCDNVNERNRRIRVALVTEHST